MPLIGEKGRAVMQARTNDELAEALTPGLVNADLEFLDGAIAGTAVASKAVVLDGSKGVTTITSATITTLTSDAIAAGDASLGVDGLAAAQGGAIAVTGGTSSTSGNAGGAVTLTGGVPGATGVGGAVTLAAGQGGATSGAGGVGSLAGGAGGATPSTATGGVARLRGGASGGGATGNGGNAEVTGGAAASTDGSGGAAIITGGALAGTGVNGGVHLRSSTGLIFVQQTAATTGIADGNWAPTAAQFINGILSGDVTTGRTLTTPTGAQLSTACGIGLAVGDAFNVYVTMIGSAGADDILTMTAGDGNVTFIGTVTLGPIVASTSPGAGTWRFRNTGTNTWVGYRIA